MTAATLDTRVTPGRHGWHALLWIGPLAALWFAVSYWLPALGATGAPTVAGRLMVHVLIALGLWLGLERSTLTPVQRRNFWLAVMIPLTLWSAVAWSAAIDGTFRAGATRLPLLPIAIFAPVIVGVPMLLRSRRVGQVLDAMPETWLVALQLYRVLGMVFLVGWLYSRVPGIFALPAGTGDLATGLMAVPTAIWLASGTAQARRAAVMWNIFGLMDFAIALSIALAINPGPFQLIVPSIPYAGAGTYPGVLIPALSVPSSILLHAVSLRQLRRRAG